MTYKQVCLVDNNKVVVTLPDDFKGKTKVFVIIDDNMTDPFIQKLELMKQASADPLFLSDIKEIQHDFDSVDDETL